MDPHRPSNIPTTPILLVLGMARNLTMMMFRQNLQVTQRPNTLLWILFLPTITRRMLPRRLSNILTTSILSVLSIVLNLNMIMFLHQALFIP